MDRNTTKYTNAPVRHTVRGSGDSIVVVLTKHGFSVVGCLYHCERRCVEVVTMTPRALAEKIQREMNRTITTATTTIISNLIQGAIDEAVKANDEKWDVATDKMLELTHDSAFKKGCASQIEKDAKLVEGTCGVDEFFSDQALAHRQHIAKQIRAQSGEGKA